MQVEVSTDHNVEGTAELIGGLKAEVHHDLLRFSDRLTRVEVHLGDENAGESGPADKRCTLEARPAGQPPVAVTNRAATLDDACSGALHKLESLLDRRFGHLADH